MKKLFLAAAIIATAVTYFSCKKQASFNENEKTADAKTWFNKYLAQNAVDPAFTNLIYHWEKAGTFTFKNGYSAVTVPVTEKNQNAAYSGRRILYLFPWKNGKGYYSTIYELIPDRAHVQANKGNINLRTFSGYINAWDLKKGFVTGAKFTNGIPTNNTKVEITTTPPDNAIAQSNTTLPTVTVTGYIPGPSPGTYFIMFMNTSGYGTSYLWNGGAVGGEYTGYGPGESQNPGDYFEPVMVNAISQDLIDQQWQNEHIHDSTNNPCVTDALNSLEGLADRLPGVIRYFFNADPNFNMTVKMESIPAWTNINQPPEGAHTDINYTSNNFNIFLNGYYEDITNLGQAASILHEAFHCQLMEWYREAYLNNDTAVQHQLTRDYGYIFPPDVDPNGDLQQIVLGLSPAQHQEMATHYLDVMGSALYQFAQSKGINADFAYCKDLAWSGLTDTRAYAHLNTTDQARIYDVIAAEKGPFSILHNSSGTYTLNTNNAYSKGTPCQ